LDSYILFLGFGKKGAGSKKITWLPGGVDLAQVNCFFMISKERNSSQEKILGKERGSTTT
jgi:hypothetical protein